MPTSPPIRWSDLPGASVGVWGVGVEGKASLRKLRAIGVQPVVVVDDNPPASGDDSPGSEVLATSAGGLERLAGCEVVVKAPGISRYREDLRRLEAAGVAVVGGLGLWMEEADRERVVLVTGTKGKSTTASVLGHLATAFGRSSFVGGNLGVVPFDPVGGDAGADLVVIEASSFQVLDLWSAPPVVVLTALGEDHVDWHTSLERYVADKLSVCTLPGVRVVVANGTDEHLRDHAALLGPNVRWVGRQDMASAGWSEALGLLGGHNRVNAVLAAAALTEAGVAGAADPVRLERAAAGFTGLPSRLQLVATIEGVDVVDDSLATNVLPAVAAIDAFAGRRVALLAGGYDRGVDYAPLGRHLRRRAEPTLVLAMPDNGPRIRQAIESEPLPEALRVISVASLEEAVGLALDWAKPDGVVLLAPAAPSFGRFADYRERSVAFRAAVDALRSSR